VTFELRGGFRRAERPRVINEPNTEVDTTRCRSAHITCGREHEGTVFVVVVEGGEAEVQPGVHLLVAQLRENGVPYALRDACGFQLRAALRQESIVRVVIQLTQTRRVVAVAVAAGHG
jgi:hypothetical protein